MPSMDSVWGLRWRSSAWFIVTTMVVALFTGIASLHWFWTEDSSANNLRHTTDTFLASFIVPILPYMLEGRISLDPSRTQSMTTWLLFESAAVSVCIRLPLAHFADQSASKRKLFMSALVIALGSTIATAFSSSCMYKLLSSMPKFYFEANHTLQWLCCSSVGSCRLSPLVSCGSWDSRH